MHKKLIARTAKLLSEPKKGRRYQGIAISYEQVPEDLEERNHGSLYAVININAETEEAQEVAELIIETFHGEFYQDPKQDALTSFEHALAKINEELADITHQGRINWLNNLNAVLGVLSNNVLHVTQAGRTDVYLYRGEKSSQVTKDLAGDSVNPLRTFINIASGELIEGDKVGIVTPGVFFHISKDELKKYIVEFQPKVAISHIADLLEGTTSDMKPNAVLIIEGITPEAASSETLDDQPDEVWVTPPAKRVESMIDTSKPFVLKALEYVSISFEAVKEFAADKILPAARGTANQTKEIFDNWQENRREDKSAVIFDTEESLSNAQESEIRIKDKPVLETKGDSEDDGVVITAPKIAPTGSLDPDRSIGETRKNEIFIRENHNPKPKWLKLEKVNFSFAGKYVNKLKTLVNKKTKNKKQLLYISTILIVVLFGGIFFMWQAREGAENTKMAQASLTEARSKYEAARSQLSAGERKNAADNLRLAENITNSLKNNKVVKGDAAALTTDIQKLLDQVENIVHPGSALFADATQIVNDNTIGPLVVGTNAFLVNKDNGSIAAVSLKNGEVSNVLDKPDTNGKFVAAAPVTARNVLILVTDAGTFYEFDTKEDKLNKQNVTGETEKVKGISAFSTNIYTLADDGKIYKRIKVTGGYSAKSAYINDGSEISGGVDLAIDSNVYVLNNTDVAKYLAGKKQTYQITDMPFALSAPTKIFADEDTKGAYITDNNRLLKLDENGKYVSAFAEDNFNGISGAYVDDSTKTVYFFAKGKVYKFGY